MPRYEYKVVPAPKKAGKVKGVKGTEARFAHELSTLMNEYGADGWEYQRTDTLPCEERSGLTGRNTTYQNMLVFRRVIGGAEPAYPTADAISSIHVAAPAAEAAAHPAPAAEEAPEMFPPQPKPRPHAADDPDQMFPSEDPATMFPPEEPAQMFPPEEPQPMRATEPAPRPQPVAEQAQSVPQPEREGSAAMPSFRSAAHRDPEPTFTSRTHEGRSPRLGSAHRPEGPTKPTLVTR